VIGAAPSGRFRQQRPAWPLPPGRDNLSNGRPTNKTMTSAATDSDHSSPAAPGAIPRHPSGSRQSCRALRGYRGSMQPERCGRRAATGSSAEP
jgi:hypothetical protein